MNQISRTISITFGIRPIKHVTFYCNKFDDIQLRVAKSAGGATGVQTIGNNHNS